MGGRDDALDMRPHAGADVQQEHDIDWQAHGSEISDLLGPAVLTQHKVFRTQIRDGPVVATHNLGVYADQGDITAEHHVVRRGRDLEQASANQCN